MPKQVKPTEIQSLSLCEATKFIVKPPFDIACSSLGVHEYDNKTDLQSERLNLSFQNRRFF